VIFSVDWKKQKVFNGICLFVLVAFPKGDFAITLNADMRHFDTTYLINLGAIC